MDLQEVSADQRKRLLHFIRQYPTAPRSYPDAIENYGLMLEVLGDICANVVAPLAPAADEEGAHFENGQVSLRSIYRARTGSVAPGGIDGRHAALGIRRVEPSRNGVFDDGRDDSAGPRPA